MTTLLPLKGIIDTNLCLPPSSDLSFPGEAFHLLGSALKTWISSLLTKLNVQDEPVVLGSVSPGAFLEGPVYVSEGATVEATALIRGPTFIGPLAEIRHGAYIRGNSYIGSRAVVGHATEVKGSVFFDEAKAGHFSYVGDSILGCKVNLGAGTKLANLKLNADEVSFIDASGLKCKSGLNKLGAILGDNAKTGCNSVLSPGTILMPNTLVYPCKHYHGTLMR